MDLQSSSDKESWAASVYYAEVQVDVPVEFAWKMLLDYQAWNPTFAGAEVRRVSGSPGAEGEVVMIRKPHIDVNGEPLPDFFAETVKIVPLRHIVWYIYKKDRDSFLHFVDFGLTPVANGVRFNIYYYAQNQLSGEFLDRERRANVSGLQHTAEAFKQFCESRAAAG